MKPTELQHFIAEAAKGMAIVQARQEAMECIVRALIAEAPPLHPLIWQVLNTAQSDLSERTQRARPESPPEIDRHALSLLNELRRACAPPASPGTSA